MRYGGTLSWSLHRRQEARSTAGWPEGDFAITVVRMDDGHDGDGGARRPIPWTKVGYGLTALWMLIVLGVTGNDVTHPFFNYIFAVPLAVWIGALVLGRLWKNWRKP